jgi:hypothetical protein
MNRRCIFADMNVTAMEAGAGEESGAKQGSHENEEATPRRVLSPEV